MTELVDAAERVQQFIQSQGWGFCFIGGLAVQRWGQVRLTKDLDLTLLTGFGTEEKYVNAMLERFRPRAGNMRDFALRNRVLLLADGNVPFDVSLGGFPFEESAVKRSSMFEFMDNVLLRTCSAEDLIVFKAFAGRGIDWHDVRGIIIRQGKGLDWSYIRTWLAPLLELKESPESMTKLEQMREELESSS
jgi:hypothetical protein